LRRGREGGGEPPQEGTHPECRGNDTHVSVKYQDPRALSQDLLHPPVNVLEPFGGYPQRVRRHLPQLMWLESRLFSQVEAKNRQDAIIHSVQLQMIFSMWENVGEMPTLSSKNGC
jgi:hypothetical protein